MRIVSSLLALVGTVVIGAGIAVTVGVGSPAGALMDAATNRLGNDYLLVAVIGMAAFALTLVVIAARAVTGVNQLTPPNPEGIPSAPRLGDGFDQYVAGQVSLLAALRSDEPKRVRSRLRDAAVLAVMEHHGCSREAARRQVDAGEWTDDIEAAAYLGGPHGPSAPVAARLAAAVGGRRWRQRGASRAAQAIVTLAEGGRP